MLARWVAKSSLFAPPSSPSQAQAQAHANEPKPKPKPVGVARICSSHRFAEPQTWLLNLRVRHPEAAEVSPATFSGARPPAPIKKLCEVRVRSAPRTACVKGLECQCPSAVWVLVPVRCGLSVCFAFVCVHIPQICIYIYCKIYTRYTYIYAEISRNSWRRYHPIRCDIQAAISLR